MMRILAVGLTCLSVVLFSSPAVAKGEGDARHRRCDEISLAEFPEKDRDGISYTLIPEEKALGLLKKLSRYKPLPASATGSIALKQSSHL